MEPPRSGRLDERVPGWNEDDSRGFIDLGRFFVPDREEQTGTILDLIPDPGDGLLVDLCCGEGLLSRAMLERFPRARVLALDRSPAMIEHVLATLCSFGRRFEAGIFDLADRSWRTSFDRPVRAFVSSLAIHHLDGPGKRELFEDLALALAPGGALAIADLVKPASETGRALAARAWDDSVRRRSLELLGNLGPYGKFRDERWNFYADPDPDPIDQPSPLMDQLHWLEAAGFTGVDVHWMKAGHAVFGGFKPR